MRLYEHFSLFRHPEITLEVFSGILDTYGTMCIQFCMNMSIRVTTTKMKDNNTNNRSKREDTKLKIFFNVVEVPCYMNCRILRTELFK